MTNVYLVTSDGRYFFRSIENARLYALKYLLTYPDEELVQIFPVKSWEYDSVRGVEDYTQNNVRELSVKQKNKLRKVGWNLR